MRYVRQRNVHDDPVAANKLNNKTDVKCDLGPSHCYLAIVASEFVIAYDTAFGVSKYIVDGTSDQRPARFHNPIKFSVLAVFPPKSIYKSIKFVQCVHCSFHRRIVRQFIPIGFQPRSFG